MKHITNTEFKLAKPSVVTIGNFDGLHMGHRQLITVSKEKAFSNFPVVVFTFNPHPMFVLKNRKEPALIMSPAEKLHLMESFGIDLYIEYPFTKDFAGMSPSKFVKNIIVEKLACKYLIVGEGYHFGNNGKGDLEVLTELGEKYGFEVICVPYVMQDGQRVSSSLIRMYLINKNIELANFLLTKPYFILGKVVEGKKLGRTLGFPTINIIADDVKLLPPNGVYITKTFYNGKVYEGITNVGCNPTVCGVEKIVETNLFDFEQFIYGETVKTNFYKWIRDEEKFESVNELRCQISKDVEFAKRYFLS